MLLNRWQKVLLAVTLVALIGGCRGQSYEDDSSNQSEQDGLIPTFRTGIEQLLQGLLGALSGGSSSSESRESGGGIGGFISKFIPKPVKKITQTVENVTARGFGELLDLFEDKFHAIFPGTRWCGGGNIASSEEDVGLFKYTDACCRDHDNCNLNINAGDSLGPLLNNGAFTRSACYCDKAFYDCLKNVSTLISTEIGTTYFNILRPQCFAYEYPIESCAEYGNHRIVKKKCVKYNLDETQNKTLEWFDNPDF